MFLRAAATIIATGVLAAVAQANQEELLLQGGAYQVTFRLELPHVEDWALDKTATICVPEAGEARSVALPVLSGNNPFARCPARNFRRDGAMLRFEIVCDGRDAATARAAYTLMPRNFSGRIRMVMGGKNMTMTEVQVGHRVGRCESWNW